ncbi:pentapeptide repeat-containing protein [Streptomyces sp. Tu 3180]|uniref:pentapeptide repeat-containing protein n=1 Tax=Streptomyces sp. Tu 3180 TaxID=2682611 RepID=UPI0032610BAD
MSTAASPPPSSTPPAWPHCGHGATPADPVGSRGIRVGDHTACLAHLNDVDRAAYLAALSPGANIDHRGTPFTAELLDQLLAALRDPITGTPHIGVARFSEASFSGDAQFDGASFSDIAAFGGASFSGDARFGGAEFETASHLGPLACGKQVILNGAVFRQPVTVEIAAREVSCARTRWASTATLHLRYAELDLRDAVFEYPVLVAARPTPFPLSASAGLLPETELSGLEPGVRLSTVGGVDAAHLALHDIDLGRCRFAGAVHLDQLKVDGWCTFATTPSGWSRRFPWRWSRRNTLTEEHHWRVRAAHHPGRATALGWACPPQDAPDLKPAAVAALYRQLRKSLEDGKNEPDAADFYYGECEMRRHDATRSRGERALLRIYWALSGYGLRATRALAWLVAAMAVTIAVTMVWGLPVDDPKPTTTGRQAAVGQQVVLTTDTPTRSTPPARWPSASPSNGSRRVCGW